MNYLLSVLKRSVTNPRVAGEAVNRFYHRRLLSPPYFSQSFYKNGVDFFERDWDNMIILDACRFDTFETNCTIPGSLESTHSRASYTPGFLKSNLEGKQLRDTVYVTANPMLYRYRDEINYEFYDEVHVWDTDAWNEDAGVVLPEDMTEHSVDTTDHYDEKRLVFHFMQPHYPFFHTLQDLPSNIEESADSLDNIDEFWMELRNGDLNIPPEVVQRAYEENLKRALDSVRRIVSEMQGKTVITSDHGNLFGERVSPVPIRDWGHPPATYVEQLVKVPWFVCDFRNRREIVTASTSMEKDTPEDSVVDDRLEALGYI